MSLRIKRPEGLPTKIEHPTACAWHEPALATVAAQLAALDLQDGFDERIPMRVIGHDGALTWSHVSLLADGERPMVVFFDSEEAQDAYLDAYEEGDEATVMRTAVRLLRFTALPSDNPFRVAMRRLQLASHKGWVPSFSEYVPERGMRPLPTEGDAIEMLSVLEGVVSFLTRFTEQNLESDQDEVFAHVTTTLGGRVEVRSINPLHVMVATMLEGADDEGEGGDDHSGPDRA